MFNIKTTSNRKLDYSCVYPVILFAESEGPDQTARMRRLILAFAVRLCPEIHFRFRRVRAIRCCKDHLILFLVSMAIVEKYHILSADTCA